MILAFEDMLLETVARFNKRIEEDANLRKELEGTRKVVQLELEDGDWWHFTLENCRVGPPGKGKVDSPDIRVIGATQTFEQLYTGELRAMKAIATRKLQIKGSLEDLLKLRKFF